MEGEGSLILKSNHVFGLREVEKRSEANKILITSHVWVLLTSVER